MTITTWRGANAAFNDPAQWSTSRVPIAGDVAVIASGTVNASYMKFSGTMINLDAGGMLNLIGFTTLDPASTISVDNEGASSATPLSLNFQGVLKNKGAITLHGGSTVLQAQGNVSLYNEGTLALLGDTSVLAVGSGMLQNSGVIDLAARSSRIKANITDITNSGLIRVVNPSDTAQAAVIDGLVLSGFAGKGSISLSVNTRLELTSYTSDQNLMFTGGAAAESVLQFDSTSGTNNVVSGFVSGDSIDLVGVSAATPHYASTGSASGMLYTGSSAYQAFRFSGVYSPNDFNFQFRTSSSGQNVLHITTLVLDSNTGSTSSAGPAPLYRFFDKQTGTHFLSAAIVERDMVLTMQSSRYTEETNGFGTALATDTGAVLVNRFFDTRNGTHFFTSSSVEAASLQNTASPAYRPDLVFEASGSFYEHSSAQPGDITVYRFFDTKQGTHFYTGDRNEFSAITNPALSTYRADLVYEPSGNFYAPAGSFT